MSVTDQAQHAAIVARPEITGCRFRLRIFCAAFLRSIVLIDQKIPKKIWLASEFSHERLLLLDDCFRGEPLEVVIRDNNDQKLVIRNAWELFSGLTRSYPTIGPVTVVDLLEIPIPGSGIVLRKYGTDTVVKRNGIDTIGDYEWATLLSKKSSGKVSRVDLIEIRQASPYEEVNILVSFEDRETRSCGAHLTEPKMGSRDSESKSFKLYIPPDGQVYMIEVEYMKSRFIDRLMFRANSLSKNEDEIAGSLSYQSPNGERKNSKRRKVNKVPKTATPKGYICLPCKEGEFVIGLYGRNDVKTGWLTEIGLITALKGTKLPDQVYTMPEFTMPESSSSGLTSPSNALPFSVATLMVSDVKTKQHSNDYTVERTSDQGEEDKQDVTLVPDLDDAFTTFRTQMREGNEAFINECIARIEEVGYISESYKLDKFGLFYNGHYGWPPVSARPSYPRNEESKIEESAVKQLADVRSLSPIRCDGTHAPISLEIAKNFNEELSEVVFNCSGQSEHIIHKSAELEKFLQLTAGVTDPDFRRSGICGFLDSPHKYTCSRSALRQALRNNSWTESSLASLNKKDIEHDFEVLGGILTGEDKPSWDEDTEWSWQSWYLYCRYRQTDESGSTNSNKDDYKTFKWRVIFACTSFEDWDPDGPLHIFDTISEFLQWYGSWYEREEHKILLNEHIEGDENEGDGDEEVGNEDDYEDDE